METKNCVKARVLPAQGTSGSVVVSILRNVIDAAITPWVAATDVDLSGPARANLNVRASDVRVVPTTDLLRIIADAEQVVWASFFFCRSHANALGILPELSYIESTAIAHLVARVVDATSVELFASGSEYGALRERFPNSTIEVGELSSTDFAE
ncbi:MAG: hypothetical protein QM784_40260 [Polyangiaceae bacterium]